MSKPVTLSFTIFGNSQPISLSAYISLNIPFLHHPHSFLLPELKLYIWQDLSAQLLSLLRSLMYSSILLFLYDYSGYVQLICSHSISSSVSIQQNLISFWIIKVKHTLKYKIHKHVSCKMMLNTLLYAYWSSSPSLNFQPHLCHLQKLPEEMQLQKPCSLLWFPSSPMSYFYTFSRQSALRGSIYLNQVICICYKPPAFNSYQ